MPEYRLFFQKLPKTDMAYSLEHLLNTLAGELETLYEKPEARTMAEWLLQHLLGMGGFELRQRRREEAPEEVVAQAQELLQRLLLHEPLQYVLGEASFYGREFHVTPAVLIPRPETEELVQWVIQDCKRHPHVRLLDIGTGSGCIPITLAAELPQAQVWGLDVSAEALAVARQNAERLGQTVTWLQQDILTQVPAVAPHSLHAVISNPPYVLEEEKALMRENVLAFEPHLALFVPNEDPLRFYRRIADVARELLQPGGKLYFEINERYATETVTMLEGFGYTQVVVKQDLRDRPRMVAAIWQ